MIKNKKNSSRVKFIDYTGTYPNLCDGVLTLEIDGVQYKFGHNYMCSKFEGDKIVFTDEDPKHPNLHRFWSSGGSVYFNGDDYDIENDEWVIDVDELPEQFWDLADEINHIINSNIRWGCCGGCI